MLAIYFILFFRLMTRHPKDAALLRADGCGKRGNLLLAPIVVAAIIAPMPYNLVAFGVGFPLLFCLAWAQHKRLAHVGATPAFLRHKAAVSSLALIAMFTFGAALMMGAFHDASGS